MITTEEMYKTLRPKRTKKSIIMTAVIILLIIFELFYIQLIFLDIIFIWYNLYG